MILVEKKVSIEKKNYQNMAIRLKKNFKRFYLKKLYKSQIKNYRLFLKKYKLGFYKLRSKLKKKKLNKKNINSIVVKSPQKRIVKKKRVLVSRYYRRLLRRLY
jgi:hypothetical protein